MARTKQTARHTTGSKAPRKQLASKAARKSFNPKNEKNEIKEESEEELEEEEKQEENPISLNNFVIKFDDQKQCENHAIDANFIRCFSCKAIINNQSEVLDNQAYMNMFSKKNEELNDAQSQQMIVLSKNDKVWICEFCDHHNKIPYSFEVPKEENPCYIIDKAAQSNEEQQKYTSSIIFCIDLSGSMDTTVSSKVDNAKGKQKFISRKDCVISALLSQLDRLKKEENPSMVGIVTFSEIVEIIGDGCEKPYIFKGEALHNYDKILEQTQNQYTKIMKKNVNENFKTLSQKLKSLETSGSTALGPGLLAAVSLASRGEPGSKVIICTDGLANAGLGSLEFDKKNKDSKKFYEKVALFAKSKGISISVITIKSDVECDIQTLSKISLETNGIVCRVDPNKISSDFKFILEDEILGANSKLLLRLNRAFRFINEDPQFLKENGCLYEKDLGNFGVSTELTMEFQVKTPEELKEEAIKSINLLKKEKLPMQMELTYISTRNKSKYLQVFTDWREIRDQKADEKIDLEVWARVNKQKLGKMLHAGDYDKAEKLNEHLNQFLANNAGNDEKEKKIASKFSQNSKNINTLLSKKKKQKLEITKRMQPSRNKSRNRNEKNKNRSRSRSRSRSNEKFSDSDEEMVYDTLKHRRSVSRSRSHSK